MAIAKDPICGQEVETGQAEESRLVTDYQPGLSLTGEPGPKGQPRKRHYFCSAKCKMTFDREPECYVGLPPPDVPGDQAGAKFD